MICYISQLLNQYFYHIQVNLQFLFSLQIKLFDIIGLQINDILILINYTYVVIEKTALKIAKFMKKKQAYFLFQMLIKFNSI